MHETMNVKLSKFSVLEIGIMLQYSIYEEMVRVSVIEIHQHGLFLIF
jgi:hypothetical protein